MLGHKLHCVWDAREIPEDRARRGAITCCDECRLCDRGRRRKAKLEPVLMEHNGIYGTLGDVVDRSTRQRGSVYKSSHKWSDRFLVDKENFIIRILLELDVKTELGMRARTPDGLPLDSPHKPKLPS
jgi:hypothetical protein